MVLDHDLGPATNFLSLQWKLSLEILGFCFYGTDSLRRGRVCNLQFLLCLASAVVLVPESLGIHDHNFCLNIETPPTWWDRVLYYPPERVDRLYSHALCSLFVASYDSQAYGGGTPTSLHMCKIQSHFTTDGQSARPLSGNWDRFFFPFWGYYLLILAVCFYFGTSSLTRGRISIIQCIRSSVRSSHFRLRFPYLYPSETGGSSYAPKHWVPFPSPLETRTDMVKVF
jgi:hypothetical protein